MPHCQRNLEAFPEVGIPQVTDRTAEITQINERLENCSRWPMLCTCLWPMRTPLRSENSREGGEGILGLFNHGSKSARKSFRVFERQNP